MADHQDRWISETQAMRPEDFATVSQMVERLFGHWRLSDSDRAALLGEPANDETLDEAVVGKEDAERIGHLLAIHATLRTLFPQDRDVAYSWMTRPNRAFGDQTPVAVVRAHGLDGLRAVRGYLVHATGV